MKKTLVNYSIGLLALGFATVATSATDEAKATYKAAKDSATATYKAARAECNSVKGNPKNVCIAEAKAADKRSKAEAEAEYKNTPKAHTNARIAVADADYAVAKEKCNDLSGNDKDVCVKEAKAVQIKAVVDAKTSKEISEVKTEAMTDTIATDKKTDEVKAEAMTDKIATDKKTDAVKAEAMTDKIATDKKTDEVKTEAIEDKSATDKKISEVKTEAVADKSAADYKVAIEKCDALSGTVKVACAEEAKSKYSK